MPMYVIDTGPTIEEVVADGFVVAEAGVLTFFRDTNQHKSDGSPLRRPFYAIAAGQWLNVCEEEA